MESIGSCFPKQYDLNHFLCFFQNHIGKTFGFGLGLAFTINTDNWFCIRLAQMHPTFLKIDLHAVDGGHLLVFELLGKLGQDAIHIGGRCQLNFVLRHEIGGICLLQLGALHLLLS